MSLPKIELTGVLTDDATTREVKNGHMETKTCSQCKAVKPVSEFHKQKASKDGLQSHCKACRREDRAEYYAENRATELAYRAKYRQENSDTIREQQAKYHSRPEVKAHKADYRSTKSHIFWESDYRARVEKYGYGHLIPSMQSFTRDELIAKYGGECAHCGGPFEQLDHWPVPVTRGGVHSLDNCVPSCKACNQRSWRQDV